MKSVIMLLFAFGCVAVVYAAHWSRRAVSATKEASVIFKETGSFAETMRRLYAHETKPDAIRLSTAQTRYIDRNFDEFVQTHGTVIRAWTEHYTEKYQADRQGSATEAELAAARDEIAGVVMMRFAKEWCELRGVA
jgi:hypothetical protein